jgi:hypothetical protein
MASRKSTGISSLKEIRRRGEEDLAQWVPVVRAEPTVESKNNGTLTQVVNIKSATGGFTEMPLAQLGQHL